VHSRVNPGNQDQMKQLIDSFNCVEDNPIFADMYEFAKMYTGGSIAGARKLCSKTTDVAINWSGGLHHAKRGEASGFCYVNDIVLAILEMLKFVGSFSFLFFLANISFNYIDIIRVLCTSTSIFIMEMVSNSHFTTPTAL
jgi:hypothetical protein